MQHFSLWRKMWWFGWRSWWRLRPWTWWRPHSIGLIVCTSQFQLFRNVVRIQKSVRVSKFCKKTRCKTCTWNVEVPFDERRYRWDASRSMMLRVSTFSLRSLLSNILRVSSFCNKKVVNCRTFSELLTEIPTQELERIPLVDQQKLVHQWCEKCLQ